MWAYMALDRVFLSAYQSVVQVGLYAAAAALVAPITVIMQAVAQVWIPHVTDLFTRDRGGALSLLPLGLETALVGYGAITILINLVAEPVIELVAGEDYVLGAQAVPFILMGFTLYGATTFVATGAFLAKRSGLIPAIAVAAVAVQLVALFALVPRFGIVGAAVGLCAGYAARGLFTYLYSQRVMPTRFPVLIVLVEILALVGFSTAVVIVGVGVEVFLLGFALILLGGLRLWGIYGGRSLTALKP